jgi:hypothetical protein
LTTGFADAFESSSLALIMGCADAFESSTKTSPASTTGFADCSEPLTEKSPAVAFYNALMQQWQIHCYIQ